MKTQRYENKYLVDEELARRVRDAVAPFVEPDRYAAGRPGSTYPIASLYLDTPDLRLYRETVEGRRDRFKLRIRTYSDEAMAPLYCEVKRRTDGVVRKTRCALPRDRACALAAGAGALPAGLEGDRKLAADLFLGLVQRFGARPRVLVRYDREAYTGRFDPDFRATFDRGLRAAPARGTRIELERGDFRPVPGRLVVVEFKFNLRIPGWLPGVVRRFELKRRSFSKYGKAVKTALSRPAASTA